MPSDRRVRSPRTSRCCGTQRPTTVKTASLPRPWPATYTIPDDARFGGWQAYLQRSDDFHPVLLPPAHLRDAECPRRGGRKPSSVALAERPIKTASSPPSGRPLRATELRRVAESVPATATRSTSAVNQDINVLALVKGRSGTCFCTTTRAAPKRCGAGTLCLESGPELHLVRRRRAEPEDSPGEPARRPAPARASSCRCPATATSCS